MKKVFMLVLFALASTVTFAQVFLGVKGGIAMSGFYGDAADGTKIKVAGRVGIGLEYVISNIFSIQSTLYFSDKGSKFNADGITLNMEYLELPIDAQFRFTLDKNINFVVAGAPYVAYCIGGKCEIKQNNVIGTNTFDSLKDWDVGFNMEASLEFNQFLVGVYNEFGLLNIVTGRNVRNCTLGLNLGYRF